ncbi:hypothetical protein N7481_000932 [Penicillium waksmanii]|uniref:uncharacterized protein n=1 Tax=Penicillium waksmanii TaxID=69791 RepID=UPI002547243C|nr:uncharacterized protein N7481_000932 [Penicillium waksmanii]KAJ6000523.1 hypothetical protein N7481_000932 [Penicillium waksmanii]
MPSDETVAVNVDELRNTKDAVLLRLMGLQTYIADLSKAYIEHTNSVINGESAAINLPAVPTHLTGQLDGGLHAQSPGVKSEAPKKRKRAPVDPNAPKRALTPYFLYMQHNRGKIANDLGDNARPKEVADEGTHRWQNMPDEEKEVYKQMYSENYETYKKNMAAYKATKAADNDPAANQLQQDFAGAENSRETDDSSSDESEEESSPSPLNLPRPRPLPRPASAARQTSPVKKRGKAAAAAEPASVKATPATNSRKGKKRKSEA